MWFAAVILISGIGFSHCLPAPASSLHYEVGTTYKYDYKITILLNEDSNVTSRISTIGRNVGYRVSSEFLLTPVWESSSDPKDKLLKLEVLKPSLLVSSTMHQHEGINRHWSKLDNLSYPPMYIQWNDGIVKKVHVLPDSPSMINIKKGIASLFSFKVTDGLTKELDVSGMCDVSYKTDRLQIFKRKFNCQRSAFPNDQLSGKLFSPAVQYASNLLIQLNKENIIESANGKEEVMMTVNLWQQAAVFVKSKMHLNFVDKYPSDINYPGDKLNKVLQVISEEMGSKLIGEPLEAIVPSAEKQCTYCKPLNELVSEFGANLLPEYLGEVKSAAGFLKFLESFRRASKKELLMLFKDTDARILTQLLDVLAAAQTDDAIDVAFQLIDFESKDITIAERFLLCLAVVPNPNELLISKTMKLLNRNIHSEKLRGTILVTLSSLVRNYCKQNETNSHSLIVQSISDLYIKEVQKCSNMMCVVNHLLAMRNAALPQHLPILLEFAKKGGTLGLMALEAVKDIGTKYFNKEVIDVLYRIYNQFWPHQETASRIMAADLIIKSNPSIDVIGKIMLSLDKKNQSEINTLVLETLFNAVEENANIRSCVSEILKNTTLTNYNIFAQNGSSSSFVKILQKSHDADVTYGVNLEMRPSGMLKRTTFDMKLLSELENPHLVSLALFIEGFGLSDEEQKENPEEHSAGMQLSILGVHLRPYIFFTGTTELMGLVWSAAGSEPNPAVQANLLLMDHSHSVVLQNGIAVDMSLKGAISTDISGTVEVSMWNKNAHAGVKNKGALLVNGQCRVDTSFVESRIDFAFGGSSVLDMVVNLDFAKKPMAICLQIDQPDYTFRHNVRKTETIPGSKHLIKTLKRRTVYYPGKSLNLGRKNAKQCRKMLVPEKKQHTSFWR